MAYAGTTQTLNANQTWTSNTLNPGPADTLNGIVFAAPGGTLNVEQSADGTNWDVGQSITVASGVGQGFSVPVYGPYLRLRYVNGGTNQTAFRIAARFSSAGPR